MKKVREELQEFIVFCEVPLKLLQVPGILSYTKVLVRSKGV